MSATGLRADIGMSVFPPLVEAQRTSVSDCRRVALWVARCSTLLTQVCGYPLQTIYRGQAALLGAPVYGADLSAGANREQLRSVSVYL
jgi:hypothetical protein